MIPLTTRFPAVFLIAQSKQGMSELSAQSQPEDPSLRVVLAHIDLGEFVLHELDVDGNGRVVV